MGRQAVPLRIVGQASLPARSGAAAPFRSELVHRAFANSTQNSAHSPKGV
jgi:hypothetical protein